MMTAMVALMDKIPLQTMIGRVKTWIKEEEYGIPKYYVEIVENTIGEATCDNILYFKK